ncbi:EamA family transporter, partial [bacterium]|nr:EamA family transporter [bacterium]
MSSKAVLAVVVLVAVLIGGNFTALKFALDHSTPLLIAGMRTVIGGTFLLGFAFLRGERFPTSRRDLFNIFMVSLSITTVSSGLLVFGVSRVTAGVASLVASTMPMFTAVLALVLMKTQISRLAGLGLAVGFAGTLVLASPSLGGGSGTIGIVSLIVSAIAWAFGNVYMKWQDMTNVSPIMLVGVQLYMSAMCLIPFALVVEGTPDTEWTIGLFAPLLYAAIP